MVALCGLLICSSASLHMTKGFSKPVARGSAPADTTLQSLRTV